MNLPDPLKDSTNQPELIESEVKILHLNYRLSDQSFNHNQDQYKVPFAEVSLVFKVEKEEDKELFFYYTDKHEWIKTLCVDDPKAYEAETEKIFQEKGDLWYFTEPKLEEGQPPTSGSVMNFYPRELELKQTYIQNSDQILHYIEKFDVFRYHEFVSWIPPVQSILEEIKKLNMYKGEDNPTRTTKPYYLLKLIKAMDGFWD